MNVTKFYRELGDYLGVPKDVKITNMSQSCSYLEGCPTCGGDYKFSVYVTGQCKDGTKYWKTFDGKLTDFIKSLS